MNRPLIVGIAGAIIVLVAIVLTFFIDREPDNPVSQSSGSDRNTVTTKKARSILDAPEPKPPTRPAPRPDAAANASPGNVGSKPAPTPETNQVPGTPVKPSFDIVRVNPQGDTVIAGRAQPDSEVSVMQGDKVIGKARADKRGEWVLVPQTPITPGTHTLTNVSRGADGKEVSSDQSVVVVVPDQGKDIAGSATSGQTGSLAIAVPKKGDSAPVVLQAPGGIGNAGLSLDAIDYGSKGKQVLLSGRAPAGAEVRVYLDNKFVGRATADDQGIWRLSPGIDIPAGLYRMRVDRVDATGKVVARVELPFSRAEPVRNLAEGTVVFVQPGNSLWRIARRSYGQGLRYTEIYQANKDQIRNPDLIYPGQVFVMPQLN